MSKRRPVKISWFIKNVLETLLLKLLSIKVNFSHLYTNPVKGAYVKIKDSLKIILKNCFGLLKIIN